MWEGHLFRLTDVTVRVLLGTDIKEIDNNV